MTQFTNIRIPADTVLDPLLVPLIDKLALDKPKWIFKAKPTNKHGRNRWSDAVFEGDKLTANTKYAREVDVFENDEELGTLGVDWAHRRGVAQRYVWTVESWRIDRQRGSANTKTSMKMEIIKHVAVKNERLSHRPRVQYRNIVSLIKFKICWIKSFSLSIKLE
jgi:hypothetical protein